MNTTIRDYTTIPKVELHRHLEGSLRVSTLAEISRKYGFGFKKTSELSPYVQIGEQEPYTIENFLSKFNTLRKFYQSPEIIRRVAHEAVEDAALEYIQYMELRFTPVALSRVKDFPLSEVMDWVIDSVRSASQKHHIQVNLIASVNRHETVEIAEKVTQLAVDRKNQLIVGLDLAGDEANYPANSFRSLFLQAKQAGLRVCIHAGEWSGAENVAYAINEMQADRIGHGVRVLEDPKVVELARKKEIPFEVCITSNYQSGVVTRLEDHPVTKMVNAGLVVTINTDDPGISQIKLSDEYVRLEKKLGMSPRQISEIIRNSARAAFLSDTQKDALDKRLTSGLAPLIP
jgi:adenosine deaminase